MLNEMVLCEELFHTPSDVAFADFIIEGHRETWPIRSKRFRTWLRRCYYHASGSAPSAAAIRSALDLFEARAQFDGPERAVNTRVAEYAGGSILILPMSIGAPLRLAPTAGGCSDARQCGSVAPLVCCRCRYRSAADRSKPCGPSSIFRTGTTLCWSSHGCWPRCDRAVPIRCSQYPASRARRRQFYQSSSGRWSIPMRPQSERSRARNAS